MTFIPQPLDGTENIDWNQAEEITVPKYYYGNGKKIYWKEASITPKSVEEKPQPPITFKDGKAQFDHGEKLYAFSGKIYQET
ncbi:hypothetical protein IF1G_11068 [Cordyceps javanica]|uniref:Uncharacterized protein n=1 Tax=Cordyceps javanica TaxID=43265 RepID=A0A545VJ70_9HYPO|nr:hypothetical protein IF1G_11068 [Cordyceps javanica]TQW01775.1 hypothetical protein IF2G_10757 [Cordyceps javanica]